MKTISFWKKAKMFPPILVRLMARVKRNGRAILPEEIANRSGLDLHMVVMISCSLNWDCCNVSAMKRFLDACGCDFEDAETFNRMTMYLRRATWKHLRTDPAWKDYYHPLLVRFRNSLDKKV